MHKVLCNHASWNSPSLPPISSLTLRLFAHCYSFNISDALPPQRPCTCSSCCLGCSSIGIHYTHPLTNLRSWHKCHHLSEASTTSLFKTTTSLGLLPEFPKSAVANVLHLVFLILSPLLSAEDPLSFVNRQVCA